ncbi:hypothetical protein GQ44DRAFT_130342 [Phaeosphaeriaceae sp. PMI808]|nr:hypothetical protein GQ44DRAFT_130342 [Phaeosphaeriaceae sp. PMI808]
MWYIWGTLAVTGQPCLLKTLALSAFPTLVVCTPGANQPLFTHPSIAHAYGRPGTWPASRRPLCLRVTCPDALSFHDSGQHAKHRKRGAKKKIAHQRQRHVASEEATGAKLMCSNLQSPQSCVRLVALSIRKVKETVRQGKATNGRQLAFTYMSDISPLI